MAKKFADLRARMSPESRARSEVKAQEMLAEMPLEATGGERGVIARFPDGSVAIRKFARLDDNGAD